MILEEDSNKRFGVPSVWMEEMVKKTIVYNTKKEKKEGTQKKDWRKKKKEKEQKG